MPFITNPYIGECADIKNLTITHNTGTSNVTRYPAYGLYDYSQTLFMFKPTELGTTEKQITGLEIEVSGYSTPYTFTNQTIKLCHSTDSGFNSNLQVDLTNLNYTKLKTVKANFNWTINSSGWQSLTFDENFCYDGTNNLVVIWENRDGSWQSGYGYAECWFDSTYGESWYVYQDNSYPASTSYGTVDISYRPNMRFTY